MLKNDIHAMPGNNKKLRKSIWVPGLLFIYLLAMTIIFGADLIRGGEWMRLISVSVIELAMIIVLHILLKKQEERKQR